MVGSGSGFDQPLHRFGSDIGGAAALERIVKQLIIQPVGWPCAFAECPPGFFVAGESLCLKTEYGENEAYVESGEAFWGGADSILERDRLIVQPVMPVWVEDED